MYIRVPKPLQEPLLKELKRGRLKSSLKYFPLILLIFSAVVFLILLVHGHGFIENIRDDLPAETSTVTAYVLIFCGVAVLMTPVLILILAKLYGDCRLQKCLYCPKCDAVDSFDSGTCSYCNTPLTESADFLFTTDKDELKLLKRQGLEPSRDIPLIPD